jgi:hypothetical protein
MKKTLYAALGAAVMASAMYAEGAFVHLEYQNIDFDGSKQKKNGNTYVAHLGYKDGLNLYETAYTKVNTKTFQPPLKENLHVDKVYFKYTRTIDEKQSFSLGYATINDNIAKETDGGNIYGLTYRYEAFQINQFLSDYRHFNVYQTDMGYMFKFKKEKWRFAAKVRGTYIHLQDRESNGFSAKAKEDYFTPSLMVHAGYEAYHFGAGAYFGKRIFAVMHDGFGVQHHAMEFDRTYMFSAGKKIGAFDVTLKYLYMRATEVPIENPDVTINNMIFSIGYRF